MPRSPRPPSVLSYLQTLVFQTLILLTLVGVGRLLPGNHLDEFDVSVSFHSSSEGLLHPEQSISLWPAHNQTESSGSPPHLPTSVKDLLSKRKVCLRPIYVSFLPIKRAWSLKYSLPVKGRHAVPVHRCKIKEREERPEAFKLFSSRGRVFSVSYVGQIWGPQK